MKKVFVCFFIVCLVFMTSSCVLFDQLVDKGLTWSRQQQAAFIKAAATRNRTAMKNLFTDNAKKQSDLNAQIDALFEIFPDSGYEVRQISFFPASYGFADSEFVIKTDTELLHFQIAYDYSDFESESTGIHDVIVRNGNWMVKDDEPYPDEFGPALTVLYDSVSIGNVELIGTYFCLYTHYQREIQLSDVKQFLKQHPQCTLSDFKGAFGEPNATTIYDCWEVSDGSGERRWIEVNASEEDGTITWVGLANDVDHLGTPLSN